MRLKSCDSYDAMHKTKSQHLQVFSRMSEGFVDVAITLYLRNPFRTNSTMTCL